MPYEPNKFPPRAPGPVGQPGVPAPRPLPAKPRKVRGGVKLSSSFAPGDANLGWAAQRWLRLMEQAGEGTRLVEGLDYGKLGQTRRLTISRGLIEAAVQGRADRAYTVRISFDAFGEAQWEKAVASMADSAIYAAKLLAGELPANIEDLFAPLGLKLFPSEASELRTSCTCAEGVPWCKHVCCTSYLFASRLAAEPFVIFAARGLDAEEIRERLRERRAMAGVGTGSVPVYAQRVPGASDVQAKTLDECIDHFWESGPELRELELPLERPAVSHPLLRRLGPSPFANASFPLVGLLASCYETISERALRRDENGAPTSDLADSEQADLTAENDDANAN